MANQETVRTREEIEKVIEKAGEMRDQGSSYAEGVMNAIDWLIGNSDENPVA